jgi:hypothetical protein
VGCLSGGTGSGKYLSKTESKSLALMAKAMPLTFLFPFLSVLIPMT